MLQMTSEPCKARIQTCWEEPPAFHSVFLRAVGSFLVHKEMWMPRSNLQQGLQIMEGVECEWSIQDIVWRILHHFIKIIK